MCTGQPKTKLSGENRDKEMFPCSANHEQDWQLYPVDLYSVICDDHTCIHIYCSVYPQLPLVIEAPWGCCGHASGGYFPRPLWFGGCATHATPCSVPGHSFFRMCLEKSERNCLTSCLYNAAILASFLFIRVFKEVLSSELVDQEQKNANGDQQKTRLEASKPPTVFTTALMALGHLLWASDLDLEYYWIWCFSRIV